MENRFFTILLVPEKSDQVKKLVVPRSFLRGFIFAALLLVALSGILIFDYVNVLNQVNENKRLRVKNRILLSKVQEFKNKMQTIDDSLDRINSFSTKLRIITNMDMTTGGDVNSSNNSKPRFRDASNASTLNGSTYAKADLEANIQFEIKQREILKQLGLPYGIGGDSDIIQKKSSSVKKKTTLIDAAKDLAAEDQPEEITPEKILYYSLPNDEAFDSDFNEDLQLLLEEFAKLDEGYGYLEERARTVELEVQEVYEHLHNQESRLKSTPMGRPDRRRGWITSRFGWRISPWDGRRKMHEGIDIAASYGTKLYAPADAFVDFAGLQGGFGKFIVLDHGYGIKSYFGHNSKIHVKKGQKVKRGHLISRIGCTGRCTGPHLHYEIRVNGVAVDPYPYLLDE